jgi:hypothetical protein
MLHSFFERLDLITVGEHILYISPNVLVDVNPVSHVLDCLLVRRHILENVVSFRCVLLCVLRCRSILGFRGLAHRVGGLCLRCIHSLPLCASLVVVASTTG